MIGGGWHASSFRRDIRRVVESFAGTRYSDMRVRAQTTTQIRQEKTWCANPNTQKTRQTMVRVRNSGNQMRADRPALESLLREHSATVARALSSVLGLTQDNLLPRFDLGRALTLLERAALSELLTVRWFENRSRRENEDLYKSGAGAHFIEALCGSKVVATLPWSFPAKNRLDARKVAIVPSQNHCHSLRIDFCSLIRWFNNVSRSYPGHAIRPHLHAARRGWCLFPCFLSQF